jgi:hypothetical protein
MGHRLSSGGVVMASSLILGWVVERQGDIPWLAWILAGVVLVIIASGVWIIEGRTTDTTVFTACHPPKHSRVRLPHCARPIAR